MTLSWGSLAPDSGAGMSIAEFMLIQRGPLHSGVHSAALKAKLIMARSHRFCAFYMRDDVHESTGGANICTLGEEFPIRTPRSANHLPN